MVLWRDTRKGIGLQLSLQLGFASGPPEQHVGNLAIAPITNQESPWRLILLSRALRCTALCRVKVANCRVEIRTEFDTGDFLVHPRVHSEHLRPDLFRVYMVRVWMPIHLSQMNAQSGCG